MNRCAVCDAATDTFHDCSDCSAVELCRECLEPERHYCFKAKVGKPKRARKQVKDIHCLKNH
jgi:hypothetical protein